MGSAATEYRRTDQTRIVELDALRMRGTGMTLEQIAEAQGVNKSTAKRRVDRIMAEVKFDAVDEYRQLTLTRIEARYARLNEIFYAEHPYVNDGRLVDGVHDVGPNIAAAREMRQLDERIAKLIGMDAPTRKVVEVITSDVIDQAIQQELHAMEALDAGRSATGETSAAP